MSKKKWKKLCSDDTNLPHLSIELFTMHFNKINNFKSTVTSRITTFQPTTDRIYDGDPIILVGRDSSVSIATRYGLDGPGSESRWGRDFPPPSRPALGPTQPPIQWVPGLPRV